MNIKAHQESRKSTGFVTFFEDEEKITVRQISPIYSVNNRLRRMAKPIKVIYK